MRLKMYTSRTLAVSPPLLHYLCDRTPVTVDEFFLRFEKEFEREELSDFLAVLSKEGVGACALPVKSMISKSTQDGCRSKSVSTINRPWCGKRWFDGWKLVPRPLPNHSLAIRSIVCAKKTRRPARWKRIWKRSFASARACPRFGRQDSFSTFPIAVRR